MADLERLRHLAPTRRQLLAGAAAGGGLLVAWWLWPRSYDAPLEPGEAEAGFGAWLTIARDGVVTVRVPQLEMGQGVTTELAQVVAVELGADWRQIAVEPAPPGGIYANLPLAAKWSPLWSNMPTLANEPDDWAVERFARGNAFIATAEGMSLAAYELPCREAAATARALLAQAAADHWHVGWEECVAAGGFIIHGDKRMSFGTLAEEAAEYDPPDPPSLRPEPAAERPLVGEGYSSTRFPRLDLPAKVDGSLLFAGDVRLPDMVYASVRHGPWGATELVAFDEKAAAGVRGLAGVVRSKRWLAAVADSWWDAERALGLMKPRFTGSGPADSSAFNSSFDTAIESGEAVRIATTGEPDEALRTLALRRRYDIGCAVQAPVETATATARFADGRLELWIGSQAPQAAADAAARAIGLSARDVVLYPTAAGGSFDARLEKQHAIEVAQIAREIGRPVQLIWSRAQEFQAVPVRTPVAALLSASVRPGAQGLPFAWRARLALPATVREFGNRLFGNDTYLAALRDSEQANPLACEGAVPPYALPHVAVDHVPVALPLPTGRMRGNAAAYTAFFTESFIDELAERAEQDPFLYRMSLLGQSPKMADCLRRATRMAGWEGGRQGSGQGLAMVQMGTPERTGRVACVAHAALGQGGVRVTRLSAAVDIGRIVNIDIARQQIEGGLIFGLSLALGSTVEFERGRPRPSRLAGLSLPTLAETPEIDIELIASEAAPFDAGELGVAAAPPAIANALFAATGVRFRRLPLLSEGI